MKHQTFKSLIKAGRYQWVNPNITEENFPKEEIRGEVEILDPKTSFTESEALELLKKEGLEPANAWELFQYGATHFEKNDDKPLILALGTSWLGSYRDRRIVCLVRSAKVRGLDLAYPDGRFHGRCVLAGVRRKQSSDTQKLSTSDTLTFPEILEINGVKYKRI